VLYVSLPWVSGCRSVMLLSSAIIFPRLRTSSAQLRAASAIRWQRFHTVPACLIFKPSRVFQTYEPFSSRSRDISHFTVTLNHPPVARYLALHRRRSEWSTKAQFPISIAAYHLGTQPSLALRTHLCSDDRNSPISISRPPPSLAHNSEHYTIQASLAVTLRRYTHPPHARMRLIGGKTECLTRTAFSSVVAACRCSHESFLSFPARTLRSAPSWRWPPPWRTSPAASCATSARSSRPPPVPSAPRVGHGATTAAQHDAGLVRHGA
jgi:hypothetical protein